MSAGKAAGTPTKGDLGAVTSGVAASLPVQDRLSTKAGNVCDAFCSAKELAKGATGVISGPCDDCRVKHAPEER